MRLSIKRCAKKGAVKPFIVLELKTCWGLFIIYFKGLNQILALKSHQLSSRPGVVIIRNEIWGQEEDSPGLKRSPWRPFWNFVKF